MKLQTLFYRRSMLDSFWRHVKTAVGSVKQAANWSSRRQPLTM